MSKGQKKEKSPLEKLERLQILEAAAAIIREDIHSATKTDYYPPTEQVFHDINDGVPDTLTYFLEEVILKHNKGDLEEKIKLKLAMI